MEFKLKVLTPIWTGGVNGVCERVHETGIIGSIRWWYEAMIRGLGGHACNIINNPCPTENEEDGRLKKEWCDACEIFDATGKSRMFRLVVKNDGVLTYENDGPINIRPDGRTRGWYYGAGRYAESIPMELILLRGSNEKLLKTIIPVFILINKWSAIGGKSNHGFGVVEIQDSKGNELKVPDIGCIPSGTKNDRNLLNLRECFFVKATFTPEKSCWYDTVGGLKDTMEAREKILEAKGTKTWDDKKELAKLPRYIKQLADWLKTCEEVGAVPIVPAVKNWLRFTIFNSLSNGEKNFIFGKVPSKCKLICPTCYVEINKDCQTHNSCGCNLKDNKPLERLGGVNK